MQSTIDVQQRELTTVIQTVERFEMTAPQEVLSSVAQGTEPSPQIGVSAPILITEQEVAFGTAAAVMLQPAKTRRWAVVTAVVLVALHRMAVRLTPQERAPRRYHPRRHDFLEDARMAREMDRL
jgi:hypothetical protein